MSLQDLFDWLVDLPAVTLYAALAAAAALENIFPPVPADTVVAFGSFLAARGERSVVAVFLATWGGNIAGAAIMYGLGRRLGAGWVHRRFGHGADAADRRLRGLYGRYGLLALFISRFLPGVRALLPPIAGALKIPPIPALAIMALASGLWYGLVTWLAYRIGASWEQLYASVSSANKWVGIAAAVIAAAAMAIWLIVRSRARAGE